jgi:hypothetical protein
LVAAVQGGQIFTSTDSGLHWTARDSNRNWVSVASSADGSNLLAAEQGGQVYISSDGGVHWTARDADRFWSAVTSSADGSKLVAVEYSTSVTSVPGHIYTSVATTTPGTGSVSGTSSDAIELIYVGGGLFNVLSAVGSFTIQ